MMMIPAIKISPILMIKPKLGQINLPAPEE